MRSSSASHLCFALLCTESLLNKCLWHFYFQGSHNPTYIWKVEGQQFSKLHRKKYNCICLSWLCSIFTAVQSFSRCGGGGLLSTCVGGLRIAGASPVEHWLCGAWASGLAACGLRRCGSQALKHRCRSCVHRRSCSAACGIFRDQGSNAHLLHGQADPLPLSHQGSPELRF